MSFIGCIFGGVNSIKLLITLGSIFAVLLVFTLLLTNISRPNENNLEEYSSDFFQPVVRQTVSSEMLNKIDSDLYSIGLDTEINVILQLSNETSKKIINNLKSKNATIRTDELAFLKLSGSEIKDIVENSEVLKIWPDRETHSFLNTSLTQIHADQLLNFNLTGSGIKVAILDTGIDSNHEMLDTLTIISKDFTGENNTFDLLGHGTHVAGIIAGDGNLSGLAKNITILNGKVLDNSGSGKLSWLIEGLDWAMNPDGNDSTDDGADIITLSLGATYGGNPEDLLGAPEILKVEEAIDSGIVVIVASGNCRLSCGSFTGVTTPGIARDVITVGAVDKSNVVASFSSGDKISNYIKPDVVAPGVSICSSLPNGHYGCMSGTSMATPFITGVVALLLEQNSTLSPSSIKYLIESSTLDLGIEGKDIYYGSGLIDLNKLSIIANLTLPLIENIFISPNLEKFSIDAIINYDANTSLTIETDNTSSINFYNGSFNYIFSPEMTTYNITINSTLGNRSNIYFDSIKVQNYNIFIPTFMSGSNPKPIVIEYYNYQNRTSNVTINMSIKHFDSLIQNSSTQELSHREKGYYKLYFSPLVSGDYMLNISIQDIDTKYDSKKVPVISNTNSTTINETIILRYKK